MSLYWSHCGTTRARAWEVTGTPKLDSYDAVAELGRLDVIVNAVSAARPTKPGPFGGGNFKEADLEAFRGWTGAVAEQAFVFLSEGVRAEARTLIQVTGGSARRAAKAAAR